MAKHSQTRRAEGGKSPGARKAVTGGSWSTKRNADTGEFMAVHATQVEAVMAAAQRSGLLHEKSGRIGGRVSPALVEQAKARTGIEADTDLIEFALANIALEDKFADTFKATRGKVDPDLDLEF